MVQKVKNVEAVYDYANDQQLLSRYGGVLVPAEAVCQRCPANGSGRRNYSLAFDSQVCKNQKALLPPHMEVHIIPLECEINAA